MATDAEVEEYDITLEEWTERIVCCECGGVFTKEYIPEHDDLDMER